MINRIQECNHILDLSYGIQPQLVFQILREPIAREVTKIVLLGHGTKSEDKRQWVVHREFKKKHWGISGCAKQTISSV